MRVRRFTIQPKAGGAEVSFNSSMAAEVSAKYSLMKDPEYKRLDKTDQFGVFAVANAMLSARDEGVELDFEVSDRPTMASALAFERIYQIEMSTPEIPAEDGGEYAENPTGTSPDRS